MKRRLLLGCLGAFFIFMIAATVISENIYYDSLPVVEARYITEGKLTQSFDLIGNIRYERTENLYTAPFDCKSIVLLSDDNSEIKEGDPLYKVAPEEILRAKRQLELSVLYLETENSGLSPSGNVNGLPKEIQLKYQINEIDISSQKAELSLLEALTQSKGIGYSSHSGQVRYGVSAGNPVSKGQPIAVVAEDTGKRTLNWSMNASDGALFGVGDSVDILADILDKSGDQEIASQKFQTLPITRADFSPASQAYSFQAKFPDDVTLNMKDGTASSLTCKYESKETYPFVIPTEAITFDSNSTGFIYAVQSRKRIYGEEYYLVAVNTEARRSVGKDTALANAFSDTEYVVSSSKFLSNEMVVRKK